MKKIEAFIQVFKLEAVKDTLTELGLDALTISEVKTYRRERGQTGVYRGHEYTVDFLPKIKLEIFLADDKCAAAVAAIRQAEQAVESNHCQIFVSPIDEALRAASNESTRVAA